MAEAQPAQLTLKNLYSALTRRDYPSYSYRVFSDAAMQGETLTRFWHRVFQDALADGADASVFDQSDGRSRTLSRLMNGSGSPRLMQDWFDSVASLLDESLIQRMTDVWMALLDERRYAPRALTARLRSLTAETAETQTAELAEFFRRQAEGLTDEGQPGAPLLYRHGVLLTWLTLYALFGGRTREEALNRLRIRQDMSAPALYRRRAQTHENALPQVISSRQSELCLQPLAQQAYFGYQAQLSEAVRLLRRRGKLAVTGIGGVGKTEFARQLLARLSAEGAYRRLAFVQYEQSLANSLATAFPALRETDAALRETQARALLEAADGTLLLIDSLNALPAEEPALTRLATYGCDILLTSRYPAPEGFDALQLSGLDADSASALFSHLDPRATEEPDAVHAVNAAVALHPLAITLFASLCRSRFWPVSRLREWLERQGLRQLSYVRQASPVNLTTVFSGMLFRSARLTEQQTRLLRLICLLPYRFWLPETLLPYAGDLCENADELADQCQALRDLGWLLVGEAGYAVHPVIAETMIQQPSDQRYPRLWAYLATSVEQDDDLAHRALVTVLTRMGELSAEAVRCLSLLEQNIGAIRWLPLPQALYDLHRHYLEDREATSGETADYWLGQALRDIVVLSRRDRLNEYLARIPLKPDCLSDSRRRLSLYTVLEYACAGKEPRPAVAALDAIRPRDPDTIGMAEYLISYSVKQRRCDHDAAAALESLEEADMLLGRHGQRQSMNQSNLDYRRATCLLDLGRPAEARPLLERCLRILDDTGHPAQSAKVMATQSTYAVTLTFLGEAEAALAVYEALADAYHRQGRERSAEYAMMRNNTALLLDSMGRTDRAADEIAEVLALDQALSLPVDVLATHHRNAALILCHAQACADALPHAEQAAALRSAAFGADSPWTADARAVTALALAGVGRTQEALTMIGPACETLLSAWGPDHRHTRNAERIRQQIALL